MKNDEHLEHIRHSLAHLLAAAVLEIWPDAKNTIGPAVDIGFYYDFEFSSPVTEKDLGKIEQKMYEDYSRCINVDGWLKGLNQQIEALREEKRLGLEKLK